MFVTCLMTAHISGYAAPNHKYYKVLSRTQQLSKVSWNILEPFILIKRAWDEIILGLSRVYRQEEKIL